jgi:hypothetical protein
MKKDFSKTDVSAFKKNLDLYLHFLNYITETCPVEFCGDAPIRYRNLDLENARYEMHVFKGIDKLAEMLGVDCLEFIAKEASSLPAKCGFYYTTQCGTDIAFFQILLDDFAGKDCFVLSEMTEEEREKVFGKVCYRFDD